MNPFYEDHDSRRILRIEIAVSSILEKLRLIMGGESIIINQELRSVATLADVKTKLDAQTALLSDLAARIIANQDDPAALQAIADEIDQHNDTIGKLDTSTPIVVPPTTAPVVTSIAPNNGPIAGGIMVTLTGTGFTGATGVTFGGVAATTFSVTNDTTISAETPATAASDVPVVVTTPNGASSPVTFTFD
jgi:hypothetical protein